MRAEASRPRFRSPTSPQARRVARSQTVCHRVLNFKPGDLQVSLAGRTIPEFTHPWTAKSPQSPPSGGGIRQRGTGLGRCREPGKLVSRSIANHSTRGSGNQADRLICPQYTKSIPLPSPAATGVKIAPYSFT